MLDMWYYIRQHGSSLWPPFDMTIASQDCGSVGGAFITCVDPPAKQLGLRTGDQVCFRCDFLWAEIFVQTLTFDSKLLIVGVFICYCVIIQ